MRWRRVYAGAYHDMPLGAGYGDTRFSSPRQGFRVIYAAEDTATGIAETIVRDRFERVARRNRVLRLGELARWSVAEIGTGAPLMVLDLVDVSPFLLGIDTDTLGARAHDAGQVFSQMLHDQFPEIAGIKYRSRLTGRLCMVIYERAFPALRCPAHMRLLEHPDLAAHLRALHIEIDPEDAL
nr:RES family NAD+ phosphorylase [Salipiger pentaromativorans]